MNFAAIVSGIFAIAKAIPIVASYIDKFVDMYVDKQIANIKNEINIKTNKRASLIKAIGKATTDEERKSLSIILGDL